MPSSKCFQCDLVSSQLQTSQIKHSPAALPRGPVTHTSNPLPLASSHTQHAVFLPRVLRVRGGREGVKHGGGGSGSKPRDTSFLCPQKTCSTRYRTVFLETQFHSCARFGKELLWSSTVVSGSKNPSQGWRPGPFSAG